MSGLGPAAAQAEAAHWRSLFELLLVFAATGLLARSRLLERLRAAVEQRNPRPWLASAACALALAAVLVLARALAKLGAPDGGFLHALISGEPVMVLAIVAGPLFYAAVRRWPRAWPMATGAVAAVLAFLLVYAPFALAAGPARLPALEPGPVRDGLVRLIRETGLSAREVYVSGTPGVDADVTGLPGRARVVVSRGMARERSPAEARAEVGHLIGHFMHGDQPAFGLLMAALAFGGVLFMARLYPPAARLMGAPGVAIADPASLPVLAALGAAWIALSSLAFNGFDRAINVRADQYSLDHAREPDGLASSLLKAERTDRADPTWIEEALFCSHPPLKSRLDHAMRWKAAHPGAGAG